MESDRPAFDAFPSTGKLRFGWILPLNGDGSFSWKLLAIRLLVVLNLALGFRYISWRWTSSINWAMWPFAVSLVLAETYSYIDSWLFGLTSWRLRKRPDPPPADPAATVDVFITCYDEPVELVRETVRAARAMTFPHQKYVLDDGSNVAMRAMADEEGVGYIVRTDDWVGKSRHAKAGNLNNALFETSGEFILVLDADQMPEPQLLDRVLGYFQDPRVAFVQTPQWFYNVPDGDPLGSQAPLFYGPIQQGKDGWNAAFFCGSNAVLRREALMQIGIRNYVLETEKQIERALYAADRVLRASERQLSECEVQLRSALASLRTAVAESRASLKHGAALQDVTYGFQRKVEAIAHSMVADDLAAIRTDLSDIPGLEELLAEADSPVLVLDSELRDLTTRTASPLAAIEAIRDLMLQLDLDRGAEAIPVQPMSTISVTEDMATAMRLHSMGWRSVYHDEILVKGLAPEDLQSALQQRLRWAQGTIQVMLRENPLLVRGLSSGQKLMYFATMWSYLSGIFAPIYLISPLLYLFFGWIPVTTYSWDFFFHLAPFLIVNQCLFFFIGWKRPTWRGQQYSLALFPLWIQAVTTAIGSVYFGKKLGFVVTPKTRQGGVSLRIVRAQVVVMVLLCVAIVFGLAKLALGLSSEVVPNLVNVFWAIFSLVMLSVVLDAVTHSARSTSDERDVTLPIGEPTAALANGRIGSDAR
jgi:cellulose synthase (UDP-forming)